MSVIWEEIKTRKIFKAATIYAAIAWGLIQIADILFPVIGIEEWVMSSMVLLAFSGFPIALIAGWMMDIRIDRRRLQSLEGEEKGSIGIVARITELAVISLFGIGAAMLYYNSANEPVSASIAQVPDMQRLLHQETGQKTIAVLPFANFSDSTQDEFFADGLSEELLNVLARNKKLRVAARTSSFQYKKTNVNIKTIAHELGVQYILEGSVRRSGELIRVTAQLIKADEDVHVFSKSWDRNISNVFEVQDEISQSVLNELKLSLLGEAPQEANEIGTKNIAAFAEYSKGLSSLRNRTKSDFENAIASFKSALQVDPDYAEALTMLAETYLLQYSYQLIDFNDAIEKARPLLSRALEINSKLGIAHAVKGLMHWQIAGKDEHSIEELNVAKVHLTKAIDINPSIAEAYMWYGSILQGEGNFSDGAKLREKAFEIDPRAAVVGYNRAKDLVHYGKYKEAMDVFNTVVRNNPNYPNAYDIAGDVSFQVGQLDQAYSMYSRLAELSEDEISWLSNSIRIYLPLGEYQLAQQGVDSLKQKNQPDYADKFEGLQAMVWIASKQFDSLHQWTESFEEDSNDWGKRLWRGFSAMKRERWQYAKSDLTRSLELIRKDNAQRQDENTIRIELFLARTFQELGDQVQVENYLDNAMSEIIKMRNEGFVSQEIRYFEAALAALKGSNDHALAILRQSVQEGFVDFWWAEADPAFDKLRKDPLYISIRDEFTIRMNLMKNNINGQSGKLAFIGK